MEFREDLIKGFAKSKKRHITEIKSYLSGVGKNVTTLYTSNGEKWTFVDFDYLEIKGIGVRHDEYCRPAQTRNFFMDWQQYAVDKTHGIQRDKLLEIFIKSSREVLDSRLEDLVERDDILKIETFADDTIKHVLKLDEKKFAFNLDGVKNDIEYNWIREGLRVNRAIYGKMLEDNIKYLLRHVPTAINENGEEVYNFSETQYAKFERLKDIRETIDSTIKYQIYRTDLKEDKKRENQEYISPLE